MSHLWSSGSGNFKATCGNKPEYCLWLWYLSPEMPTIGHFTIVRLVAWPLNKSKAGVDLVLIEMRMLFLYKFLLISIRTVSLTEESSKVAIETKSTEASLSFKGQAAKHTTAKWVISCTLTYISITKSPLTPLIDFTITCDEKWEKCLHNSTPQRDKNSSSNNTTYTWTKRDTSWCFSKLSLLFMQPCL